jgi:putative radical SAM enzyme (TIGR03279 family)
VEGVIKDSVADNWGVKKGDRVIDVNGRKTEDLIDLHFLTARPRYTIRIRNRQGKDCAFAYSEKEGALGILPEPIKVKRCKNKCVFCFVHQLPHGMRKTLYVKDEDYRLSFLSGNFVTLSDVTEEELKKIIRYRLSPIYVSIHTTDNELRRMMLSNPDAKDITAILSSLTRNGITVHGQIVLCPGFNDGEIFLRTVEELSHLYPGLDTVAVVPVGITVHRRGLPPIENITVGMAKEIVAYVESFAREFRRIKGDDFIYAADEFYLMAERNIPSEKRYGEFPQIENGVGIVRKFIRSANRFSRLKVKSLEGLTGIAVTGVLPAKLITNFISLFNGKTGSSIRVLPVKNGLFGKTVTVTGLLAAEDIKNAVKGKKGEMLFIPSVMLRETGDRFLDDISPEKLGKLTGKRVVIFEPEPLEYYRNCLEIMYN